MFTCLYACLCKRRGTYAFSVCWLCVRKILRILLPSPPPPPPPPPAPRLPLLPQFLSTTRARSPCLAWTALSVIVCWLRTSQQQACVSQRRICSDGCTCCRTETEVTSHTGHLTQSQCIDTGQTSSSIHSIKADVWQGSHESVNFQVAGMTRPRQGSKAKEEIEARDRYHGGRQPSNDDSFHSPTVIPPSALDKPQYHEALPSSANVQ